MPFDPTRATDEFLTHQGRMARAIREHDWLQSPLGPISAWPLNLRIALRLLLSSKLPMFLWWGNDISTMMPTWSPCDQNEN